MNVQMKRVVVVMLTIVGITISVFANQLNQTPMQPQKPVASDSQYQPEYREGQVIVKFKQQSNVQLSRSATNAPRNVDVVMKKIGAIFAEQLMPLSRSMYSGSQSADNLASLYVVKFSGQSVEQAIESLKQLEEVEFAEPNYIVKAVGAVPSNATQTAPSVSQASTTSATSYSDPMFNEQWGLQAINMPALWEKPIINPKRPVIAILDTGVDINHPDLAANIWTNESEKGNDEDGNGYVGDVHGWNFIDGNADVSDFHGHGTHCAGIAAAVGNNGIGVVGSNPDALILPVKVLANDGYGDEVAIIQGIDYAVANGADIISMSMGHIGNSPIEETVLLHASEYTVLVAAAGNDGVCMVESHQNLHGNPDLGHLPQFPAAYEFVIGVQATTPEGELASFSNFDCDGPDNSTHRQNYNYDVKVPGEHILSTVLDSGYAYMDGTSMACPMLAGAISRLMQSKKITDNEALRKTLILSDNGNVDMELAYHITAEDIGSYHIGETFTADVNGVEITFRITGQSIVQVGNGQDCSIVFDDSSTNSPITIPEEINGYTVTTIGSYAFYGCNMSSIQIPSTITKIGTQAFMSCHELKSLLIPKKVEDIDSHILQCPKLEKIVVEDGNPRYDSRDGCNAIIETNSNVLLYGCNSTMIPNTVVAIGMDAFCGSGISSIEIPSSVKVIGAGAFEQCKNLKTMNVPDGVEVIEMGAFSWSGIETINISKTVNSIGIITPMPNLKTFTVAEENPIYDSRNNCNAIIETATNTLVAGFACSTIPESVTGVASDAFYYAGITSLYIPKTVTYIGSGAFMGNELNPLVVDEDNPVYDSRDNCNAIIETATNTLIFGTSYSTIPASVKHIGDFAFWGAVLHEDVIIPKGVESIGERAYYGPNFHSLSLPASIKRIDSHAFAYGNPPFTAVFNYTKEPIKIDYSVFYESYSATLYVPTGSKTAYEQAEGWKHFENIVEKDIEDFLKFTIIYMIDGEIFKTETLEYGDTIFAPQLEKEGYTFSGWQNIPATMPAHDIEVEGTYTINSYKLEYWVDGGLYKEYSVDFDSPITPEPSPEKEGHTFSGWGDVPVTMPSHGVTVNGTFSINSY